MGMFEGKTAIVMGASTPGGMGAATARRLHLEGAKVVVSGLGDQPLQDLALEINGLAFEADITSKQANVDLVNFTLENYGQIDLAVNHVGLATRSPIAEESEEHLQLMTEVNFFGTYWFIRAVADVMEQDGAIVTTSSLVASDVSTGMSAYACAKAAAERFVEAAAVEYRQKRLRINSIIPSINDTAMLRKGIEQRGNDFDEFVGLYKELTPLGRISTPEDIAGMVCLMLHPEFFETGQHIHCSGGNSLLGQPRLLVTQELK